MFLRRNKNNSTAFDRSFDRQTANHPPPPPPAYVDPDTPHPHHSLSCKQPGQLQLLLNTLEEHHHAELRNKLLTTISHELLTPLNSVIAPLEISQHMPALTETDFLLQTALCSANHLKHVVMDLVYLSQLYSGDIKLLKQPFKTAPVLTALQRDIEQRCKQAGLTASIQLDPTVTTNASYELLGDATRFIDMTTRLVEHAMHMSEQTTEHMTEQGSIQVAISAHQPSEQACLLHVAVTDGRINTTSSAINTVFNSFTQLEDYVAGYLHTGQISLSIVYLLVQQMGGTFRVKANPGEETTLSFTAHFPRLDKAGSPQNNKPRSVSGVPSPTKLTLLDNTLTQPFQPTKALTEKALTEKASTEHLSTVHPIMQQGICRPTFFGHALIVEDNPTNQMVLKCLLKRLGFSTSIAQNGQIALELADTLDCDVILMDCQMPVMDGFEATEKLRRRTDRYRQLPIIAVTANITEKDKHRCLTVGMNDFLTKPIHLEAIETLLQRWLPTHRITTEANSVSHDHTADLPASDTCVKTRKNLPKNTSQSSHHS